MDVKTGEIKQFEDFNKLIVEQSKNPNLIELGRTKPETDQKEDVLKAKSKDAEKVLKIIMEYQKTYGILHHQAKLSKKLDLIFALLTLKYQL